MAGDSSSDFLDTHQVLVECSFPLLWVLVDLISLQSNLEKVSCKGQDSLALPPALCFSRERDAA